MFSSRVPVESVKPARAASACPSQDPRTAAADPTGQSGDARTERRVHSVRFDHVRDECPTRIPGIEQVNQAVGEHGPAAEVRAADEENRSTASLDHVLVDDPREVRVAPVVHVLVGWTGHRAPVDGRVAEKHAEAFPGWQRGIEGSNVFDDACIDWREPHAGHLGRVLPRATDIVQGHAPASDVGVHGGLVPRIAELDDDIVDRPGTLGCRSSAARKSLVSVDPWCSPIATRAWRCTADARNATAGRMSGPCSQEPARGQLARPARLHDTMTAAAAELWSTRMAASPGTAPDVTFSQAWSGMLMLEA